MHRLHALIVIASFIIALRGLQVLQLFGVVPKSSQRHGAQPCFASGPHPPYAATSHAASTGSSSSCSNLVPLVHWLKVNGADIEHVGVSEFSGLRGLQALRAFNRHDVILAVPTNLTVGVGTFSAAHAAVRHPRLQQLLALPDGDTLLETVALLHEALLHGYNQVQLAAKRSARHTSSSSKSSGGEGDLAGVASASAAAAGVGSGDNGDNTSRSAAAAADQQGLGSYLETLPTSVPLPVFAGGSSSSDSPCVQLISVLPHLHRLTSKRYNGLREAWPRVQALLKALPKPSGQALARLNRCEAWQAFLWAYSIAQTRSVTLEVEELPNDIQTALQQQGVEDVGVLVPLLDMANHGSGDQVNARVLGDGTAFRLVATQHIAQGQQIFISYNPSDDETPHCSWRWLLEYGFTIQQQPANPPAAAAANAAASSEEQQQQQEKRGSADPRRQCYAFNLTAGDVLHHCLHASPATADDSAVKAGSSSSSSRQQWQQLLAAAGLKDSSWWVELDGFGKMPEGVLSWVGQVLKAIQQGAAGSKEQAPLAGPAAAGAAGVVGGCKCGCSAGLARGEEGSGGDDGSSSKGSSACVADCVVRRVLQQRRQELRRAWQAAQQQLQHQQDQSCPADDTAAAAADEQQEPGSCPRRQPGIVGRSSSSSSATACPLEDLVTVAWDAVKGLAAAFEGLQADV